PRDAASAVGGALEGRVVHQHQHAVAAQLHVELEHRVAERRAQPHRGQRVLGREPACAAVRSLAPIRPVHLSDSTSPLTNHFCISTTTATGGSIARTAVAITRFHSIAASPPEIIRFRPITTGYIDSCVVTSSGHRYWFQP